MKRFLFGASDQARVVARAMKEAKMELHGVIDQNPNITTFEGMPVAHYFNEADFNNGSRLHIAIGDNTNRFKVAQQLKAKFFSVIHPSAVIDATTQIGNGTAVHAGALINNDVIIGQHCIINTGAVVEHDCEIGDFAHISPNATLTGRIKIGTGTQVGAGATVLPGINIGKWAVIGAGAVILQDVPDGATVVGNPGKIIKIKDE